MSSSKGREERVKGWKGAGAEQELGRRSSRPTAGAEGGAGGRQKQKLGRSNCPARHVTVVQMTYLLLNL